MLTASLTRSYLIRQRHQLMAARSLPDLRDLERVQSLGQKNIDVIAAKDAVYIWLIILRLVYPLSSGLQPWGDFSKLERMTPQMPLLVFTDLDGTLLSHTDYSWDAARPALEALANIGAGVVLASSKTAPEISVLRQEMGLQRWPAIVENGAGLLAPNAQAIMDHFIYAQLRAVLDNISASLRMNFCGFGDLDALQIANLTGLSPFAASLAKQRAYSEPGTWRGSALDKVKFLEELRVKGVAAREGGRFLTLSFGATKADQMAKIKEDFSPLLTIALGDAPNDVEMLEAADFGVVIANAHGTPLPLLEGETQGRIMRTRLAGPEGWNAAIAAHLARLRL